MMENFIITIGRQAGSGGREIGMRLAQRLGIPYYGRQELMQIAKGTLDYEEVQVLLRRTAGRQLAVRHCHQQRGGWYGAHPLPAYSASLRKNLL